MVTLHVSHKQQPEEVLKIAKGFLQENIPVTLCPTNDKTSRRILKEIEMQELSRLMSRRN